MTKMLLVGVVVAKFLVFPGMAAGQVETRGSAVVKYISTEAVYVNAGREEGLSVGDTLRVMRNRQLIATLVVQNLSSHSAACRALDDKQPLRPGDAVLFRRQVPPSSTNAPAALPQPAQKKPAAVPPTARPARKSAAKRPPAARRRVEGSVSVQHYWQQEMAGSAMGSMQPSFGARLTVKDLGAAGLDLRLRYRTRMYARLHAPAGTIPRREWVHQLFEAALVYEAPRSPWEYGFGRVLSSHVRGVGYIDGGYFSRALSRHVRVGAAVGTEPDEVTSRFRSDRSKYGVFFAWEGGALEHRMLSATLAYSGSTEQGLINREFLYLQNNFWWARRLSLYQSVEIEVNRKWRRAAQGRGMSFANFFLTANVHLTGAASLRFSYDARRNVRTYSTYHTPDSLFDGDLRQGASAGFNCSLPGNMSLSADAGVRWRPDQRQDHRFASATWNLRHIPARGHNLAARVAMYENEFTRAWRPLVAYRLPVGRRLQMSFSSGAYLYRTGPQSTASYFAEVNAYQSLSQRFFLSWNYRQYFDRRLQSASAFVDLGMAF